MKTPKILHIKKTQRNVSQGCPYITLPISGFSNLTTTLAMGETSEPACSALALWSFLHSTLRRGWIYTEWEVRRKIFLNHSAAGKDPPYHPSQWQESHSADQGHLCLWLLVTESYLSGTNFLPTQTYSQVLKEELGPAIRKWALSATTS